MPVQPPKNKNKSVQNPTVSSDGSSSSQSPVGGFTTSNSMTQMDANEPSVQDLTVSSGSQGSALSADEDINIKSTAKLMEEKNKPDNDSLKFQSYDTNVDQTSTNQSTQEPKTQESLITSQPNPTLVQNDPTASQQSDQSNSKATQSKAVNSTNDVNAKSSNIISPAPSAAKLSLKTNLEGTEKQPDSDAKVSESKPVDPTSLTPNTKTKAKSSDEVKKLAQTSSSQSQSNSDSTVEQNIENKQAAVDSNNSATPQPLNTSSANTISDILVQMGILEQDRADQVKLAEIQTGKSQEEIMRTQNIVDDVSIAKAKAKFYNIPFIDLSKIPVSPEAVSILPQQVAQKFNVFPVSIDEVNRQIVLAMADPLNLTAIEFIEQKTGMSVKPYAANPSELQTMIATGYTTSLAKEVSEALRDVSVNRNKVRTLDASQTGLIREEKVAEIVTHILGFAVKSRASDVHIEPQEKATRVRYRIDGILQEKLTIPRELHDALISRIKILSGMKIDEKRVPQDGRFNFKSDLEEVDLRVSTLPTTWGEKIVMRLLKKSGGIPDLPELGLRGRALKNLQEAILRPHGIILITGPTGSGKTTTLYSIIQKINTPKVNIMTLEDPIEYRIPGVNQVQANPAAGLTFAAGMRSFLRQDPNIILVGEIRDQETADLAIQASLTGHLVFSTLHTNDAAGALPRLLDMGAEPYLLASSITAIVGQRVVRKIHNDCKTSFSPDPKIIEEMKDVLGNLWQPENQDIQLYKGQGDQECNNSGYLGRMGIFEVLPVSEKISRLILEHAPSGTIDKLARDEGMISMKQDGYLKVLEGITTLDEVLRVAQE